MGSSKSGRWLGPDKKVSVKQCLRLTRSDLKNSGLVTGKANDVIFSWRTGEGEQDSATVRARVTTRLSTRVTISLAYTVRLDQESHEVDETIHVIKADHKDGGNWWIQCPAQVNGQPCSRRVGVVYLPPGARVFGCRHCHDLAPTKKGGTDGLDMDTIQDAQVAAVENSDVSQDEQERPEANATTGKRDTAPPPLRAHFYVDHGLRQLDPKTTTLTEVARTKLVDELLLKMTWDAELPEGRFAQVLPEIQRSAPVAFASFAARILREGCFSPGAEQSQVYFPFHRMGSIVRLYLIEDLKVTGAADLLLANSAVAAFVEARILLSRAAPLGPDFGPPPSEEKLFRTQAVTQQKVFLNAMAKLQPKPSRPMGRSPARESA